jgi:hypothetical protein
MTPESHWVGSARSDQAGDVPLVAISNSPEGSGKKVMASAGKNPQRIDVASHHESMDNRWIIISHY